MQNELIFKLRQTKPYEYIYMPLRNAIVERQIRHDPVRFIKGRYKRIMGRPLNLENPVTYTEKLQWRKVYDGDPRYTVCADKVAVRDYLRDLLGFSGDEGCNFYFPKWYGVYSTPNEIPFDSLPNSFVLKTNHASAQVIVCPDKNRLNLDKVRKTLNKWIHTNFYYAEAERHYKPIIPKIICEELLDDDITDYRIHCFRGEPEIVRVTKHDPDSPSGYSGETYTCDWEKTPYVWKSDSVTRPQPRPDNLSEMLDISRKISKSFEFIRVDLYSVKDKIYFSELTLTPDSGYQPGLPYEWDKKLGELFEVGPKAHDWYGEK